MNGSSEMHLPVFKFLTTTRKEIVAFHTKFSFGIPLFKSEITKKPYPAYFPAHAPDEETRN